MQAAVTTAGLGGRFLRALALASRSLLTGRPAAPSIAARASAAAPRDLRKTRAADRSRVTLAGESLVRPATRAPTVATESAALQIGSHVVPSQRRHNAGPIPGCVPQRTIPTCWAGGV